MESRSPSYYRRLPKRRGEVAHVDIADLAIERDLSPVPRCPRVDADPDWG